MIWVNDTRHVTNKNYGGNKDKAHFFPSIVGKSDLAGNKKEAAAFKRFKMCLIWQALLRRINGIWCFRRCECFVYRRQCVSVLFSVLSLFVSLLLYGVETDQNQILYLAHTAFFPKLIYYMLIRFPLSFTLWMCSIQRKLFYGGAHFMFIFFFLVCLFLFFSLSACVFIELMPDNKRTGILLWNWRHTKMKIAWKKKFLCHVQNILSFHIFDGISSFCAKWSNGCCSPTNQKTRWKNKTDWTKTHGVSETYEGWEREIATNIVDSAQFHVP